MAQYLSQCLDGPIWLDHADISVLQTRILGLEAQIENIEAQISELICQKEAKVAEIASVRNVLSPIRRVPLEILAEIFELSCLPEGGIFSAFHDGMFRAHILTRVCISWRIAAHASSRIWSKLCVNQVSHRKLLRDPSWVKEWISRSQGSPLDIYLDISDFKHETTQLLTNILAFRDQIRLFHMSAQPATFHPLFRLPGSSLPVLEEVSLVVGGRTNPFAQGLFDGLRPFQSAPKLRHFGLRETSPNAFVMALAPVLPAEQLISLEVAIYATAISQPAFCVHTLCRLQALVSLKVQLNRIEFDIPSISLPVLRFLDISCHPATPANHGTNLLPKLIAPLLESLTLRWQGQYSRELSSDVVAFQNLSTTILSSLTLIMDFEITEDRAIITESFVTILSTFSAVRSLHIHGDTRAVYCLNSLFKTMTYTRDRPVLLPRLTEIELIASGSGAMLHNTYPWYLSPMIVSRCWLNKPDVGDAVLPLGKVRMRVPFKGDLITTKISNLPGLFLDFEVS